MPVGRRAQRLRSRRCRRRRACCRPGPTVRRSWSSPHQDRATMSAPPPAAAPTSSRSCFDGNDCARAAPGSRPAAATDRSTIADTWQRPPLPGRLTAPAPRRGSELTPLPPRCVRSPRRQTERPLQDRRPRLPRRHGLRDRRACWRDSSSPRRPVRPEVAPHYHASAGRNHSGAPARDTRRPGRAPHDIEHPCLRRLITAGPDHVVFHGLVPQRFAGRRETGAHRRAGCAQASAAASPRPSAMPPAATTGIDPTSSTTAGTSPWSARRSRMTSRVRPCAMIISTPADRLLGLRQGLHLADDPAACVADGGQ